MRIHFEGMGLTGCMLAVVLSRHAALLGRPLDLTWHDTDQGVNAWKASTGAIYPSGSTKFGPDELCRIEWLGWIDKALFPRDTVERMNWVFSSKRPPHGGKYGYDELSSGLKLAHVSGGMVNAQSLVPLVRDRFRDRRVYEPPARDDVDFYVVAHGWGRRLNHAYWGWTRLVELNYPDELKDRVRPGFYFRRGRFVMTYAYPVPGTKWWYAGSSIIRQRLDRLRNLEAEPKYERWKHNFVELGNGAVEIVDEGPFMTGWRPAASPNDKSWVTRRGNVVTVRPLWNSGIRHFPKQALGVSEAVGLRPRP